MTGFQFFFFLGDQDGREEKKPTSTELCPRLVWCLILKGDGLTGPNFERWLGCTRKPTRAWRSTCMRLCPCAGESVVSPQKKVGVYVFTLVLSLISVASAYLEKGLLSCVAK